VKWTLYDCFSAVVFTLDQAMHPIYEMFIQLQKIAYNVLSKILEFVIQK